MSVNTFAKLVVLTLSTTLAACGGGGGSSSVSGGGGGSGTSATSLINWTWLAGSETFGQPGNLGTKGTPDATTTPQALEGAISWADTSGNLWLFGGGGGSGPTDFNDLWKFDTSTKQWTWVNGPAPVSVNGTLMPNPNQQGSYITKGTAQAIGATGPGARQYSARWTDSSGNLWMFGGYVRTDANGSTAYANDMWTYSTTTDQWTWVSGNDTTFNQLGTYGTKGGAVIPETTNIPGTRWGAATWSASGDVVWLFGGKGFVSIDTNNNNSVIDGYFNDLWKYEGGIWTWMDGTNLVDQVGSYGTKGRGAPGNIPGARSGSVSWIDNSGNLWLFGGYKNDANGSGDFNDLWKYDDVNWIWVGGSDQIDQPGIYGTEGVASADNIPGGRHSAVSWTDGSGNFWLFGGRGYDSAGHFGELNDLWKFEPTSIDKKWTWMSGSKIIDQMGVNGTLGGATVPEVDNVPGGRDVAVSWSTATGLWMFGGQGIDGMGDSGYLNDMWHFEVAP